MQNSDLKPKKWLSEKKVACLMMVVSAIVAAKFSPIDFYFVDNFSFFFGSQIAILALLLFFKPRAAIYTGVIAALSLCFVLFYSWNKESLGWVLYVFGIPGPAIGVIAIGFSKRYWNTTNAAMAALVAAIVVLVSAAVSAGIIYFALLR